MKRIFNYILPLLALVAAVSCSEQISSIDSTEGTGTLSMRITTTRTQTDAYDPMDHLVVSIYNKDGGLLRRYRSKENIPASLELLAGDYRVEVAAGQAKPASFTERLYTGAQDFTVTAGATALVEVRCNIQGVVAEAKFDKSIGESFGTDFYAWIVASETFVEEDAAQGNVPALKYTSDAKGYFTLPEGVTSLAWYFKGEHPNPKYGTIVKQSVLTDIKTPGKYVLTFKFSPDLPGYVEAIPIRVDTSTDDEDDTIVFSPDPILEGVGFDIEEIQRYTSGEKSYTITAMAPIATATIENQSATIDLLATPIPIEGIEVEKLSDTDLKITLSELFFADRVAGDHALTFHVTDTDGGELNTESPYRFEGMLPIDANNWTRTATMRYISFGDEVTFSLRVQGGEWLTQAGVKGENDVFVGTFAPEWIEQTNEAKLKVSTMSTTKALFPGQTYEYKGTVGSIDSEVETFETSAAQTIPGGDMEDGSMSCFNNNHGSFWDSGNNTMADLCEQSTYNGMQGEKCAKLKASKPIMFVNLAAGNLFTGSFSLSGMSGSVAFGQEYNWKIRPAALSVRYFASLGNVNQNQHSGPLAVGSPDKARIFVAIIDWNDRHTVTSGSDDPQGVWDPATMSSINGKKIIAYGSLFIEGTTEGDSMVEVSLPIHYYDTTAKPSGKYTLVISAATSAYGDFMNGCTTSVMYVDDFKWVY